MQKELDDNLEFWTASPDVPPTDPLKEKAGDFRYQGSEIPTCCCFLYCLHSALPCHKCSAKLQQT